MGGFGDGFIKRKIAMKAVQMAIHEERMARSMRGKGPAVDKDQLKPGMKIDVYERPLRKDDSGWRGPCTVLDETEGTADYKWQSTVKRTDVTKCRIAEIFFSVFGADDQGVYFNMSDSLELRLLRDVAELLAI